MGDVNLQDLNAKMQALVEYVPRNTFLGLLFPSSFQGFTD
jgi:hypothetical protein